MTNGHVEQFIECFHSISETDNINEVFTKGCCYWFAFVLCSRFPGSRIMYDPDMCHFMAGINGMLFDITGNVTGLYDAIPWDEMDDEIEKQRIVRDCVKLV